MRILFVGLALCTLLNAGCGGRERQSAEDEATAAAARQAVAQRMDDYIAALRADQAVSDFWAEQMQAFEPEFEVHSRTEMAAFFTDWIKTTKFAEVSVTTLDVFVHDQGTVAYHFAAVDETLTARDGTGAPVRARNNLMTRWVMEADGTWRIDRLMAVPRPKEPPDPAAK